MSKMKITDRAITALVIATAMLPVIGFVTAFWTGEWRWLVLCFAICLFL